MEGCRQPTDRQSEPIELLVQGVEKSFDGHTVLRGVDLEIRQGEIVAIVGGSGAGKTVLLDHMVGLLRPDRGRVLVADHSRPDSPLVDLTTLDTRSLERLRTHWAVIFQTNALYSGSVYDNIALWLREHSDLSESQIRQRARESLEMVGLGDDESVMAKTRDQLSGGMAKRVAVARGLAMDPAILFYDEPTTGLDPHSASQIQELICATHSKPRADGTAETTVIITHDKDLLRRLRPRVAMLHHGQVHFDGPYDQFEQADSEIIKPYFEMMPALQRAGDPA